MAPFMSDSLTGSDGTALQAHAGEIGADWTKHSASTGDAVLAGNRLRGGGAFLLSIYFASGAPDDADYDVVGVVHPVSLGAAELTFLSVFGRVASGAQTYYEAFVSSSDGAHSVTLQKMVAGAATSLGSWSTGLTAGVPVVVRLRMRGTSIKVLVDGVERISVTDSAIASAGKAGAGVFDFHASSNSAGLHLESVEAEDALITSTPTPGGAIAGGTATTGRASMSVGGGVAGGMGLGASALLGRGGGTADGTALGGASAALDSGGAIAGGSSPGGATVSTAGGAIAGGVALAGARGAITPGGATAGGVAPAAADSPLELVSEASAGGPTYQGAGAGSGYEASARVE